MDLQFGALLIMSLSLFGMPTIAPTPHEMIHTECTSIAVQRAPNNVDMARVRDAWFGWYNDYRSSLGLPPYAHDQTLESTARNWSYYSVKRGTIDHKRAWQAAYYDYAAIEQWFADLGVTFTNVRGKTFTENIGWGPYACTEVDCTDELIAAIRSTFDFFLSEKGKGYSPHYNAIVSDAFTTMGLGIAIDPAMRKYYLTAHFAAEIEDRPFPCR